MSGFQYVKESGAPDQPLVRYHVASGHSSVLASGDVLKLTGTAHTDGTAQVDAAAAGNNMIGIAVSFEPNYTDETLNEQGLAASTAGYVMVQVSGNAIYEVAGDGTNALAVTSVGLNTDIIATAATRSGGITKSNMVLDTGTTDTPSSATHQFRIMGLKDGDVTTAQKIFVMPVEIHSKIVTGA